MICSRTPELVFVLEVIGNQWMVDACTFSNISSRCALEAILGECFDGGIEELLLSNYAALLLFSRRLLRLQGSFF
jgi:hypothetical protein